MRILVVGTGGVGSAFATIARRRAFFDHCALADYDVARAEYVVAATDDGRFAAHGVDASSREAVGELVRATSADVVLNAVDPRFDEAIFDACLDAGVTYVVIGTAAVKNPGFLSDACYAFPGHVIAGLDAKDGKVAVEGWSKLTGHDVIDLAKKFEEYGVEAIVYTDIGRDGMMTGVNVDATFKLAQQLKTPVIASGGLNSLQDVQVVCEKLVPEGIIGVIAGRALYEGKIDLKKAQAAANKALGKE